MAVLGMVRLPGGERSVAQARSFVRGLLGTDHPAFDDAELCTSELVTNAIAHTASGRGGHVSVTVAAGTGVLQISVADDGAGGAVPHLRDEISSEVAEDGRGLRIVATLAAEWGVEMDDRGTTTWVRLRP